LNGLPGYVKAARLLFFANAIIWLAFAVATLVNSSDGSPNGVLGANILAGLMLGNAAAMLLAGLGLGRQNRLFFYFAVLVLVVNIFLTLSDQFGVYDFITLLIDGFLLGLLLATRSYHLKKAEAPQR
jgi:hypothetical protein